MIPQLAGDRRLHAQIPPAVIEGVARQLRFLFHGTAGHQIRPFTAGGVIQIPVHQLTHPGHLRPVHQRRVDASRRFINLEIVLFAQPLGRGHRIESALLHQGMQNSFRFVIAASLQQEIGLPVAPFILLFGLHRQTRQPGVQAAAIAVAQRHTHAALYQRGRLRAHDRVVAPAGLFVGEVIAHQSPRHDIAQLLSLIVIQLLCLGKGGDH